MISTKFDIKKFINNNNWRIKMLALLTHQKCEMAQGKEAKLPNDLTFVQKQVLIKKAYSTLLLSLGDKALEKVSEEKITNKL